MADARFAKQLKELRQSQGISQRELADKIGLTSKSASQTISSWERAIREPDIERLRKIAKALNTNMDTLLDFKPHNANRIQNIAKTLQTMPADKAERILRFFEVFEPELEDECPKCAKA
jgi:transcriptional regulator with XRE-family HTH domain